MARKIRKEIIKNLIQYKKRGPTKPPKFEKLPDGTFNCLADLQIFDTGKESKICELHPSPFSKFEDLIHHILSRHEVPNLKVCHTCEFISIGDEALRLHKQKECALNEHKCPSEGCSFAFKTQLGLSRHINSVHKDMVIYSCQLCEPSVARFRTRSELDKHLTSNHNHLSYSCNFCNKMYKTSSLLKRHQKTHHFDNIKLESSTENDFKSKECDVCKQVFSSNQALEMHKLHPSSQCQLLKNDKKQALTLQSMGLPDIGEPKKTSFGLFYHCPVPECMTVIVSKKGVMNHLLSIHTDPKKEAEWFQKATSICIHCKQTVECDSFYLHHC